MNKETVKKEFNTLIKQGKRLYYSMFLLDEESKQALMKTNINIDELPDFKMEYQSWYTQALFLMKLVAPHRINDFEELYKKKKSKELILLCNVCRIMPVKYTPYELHRLNGGTTCYVSAKLKRSWSNLRSFAHKQACRLASLDYLPFSFVVCRCARLSLARLPFPFYEQNKLDTSQRISPK